MSEYKRGLIHGLGDIGVVFASGVQQIRNFNVISNHKIDLGHNRKVDVYICDEGHLICLSRQDSEVWEFVGVGTNLLANADLVKNKFNNGELEDSKSWVNWNFSAQTFADDLIRSVGLQAPDNSGRVYGYEFAEHEEGVIPVILVKVIDKTPQEASSSSSGRVSRTTVPSKDSLDVRIETIHRTKSGRVLLTKSTFKQ